LSIIKAYSGQVENKIKHIKSAGGIENA